MDQLGQRLRIKVEFFLGHRGDQFRAGLVLRLVEHVRARMLAEMPGVFRGEERALMMIEPPSQLRRIGILEIDDDIFVAVKKTALPWMLGAMGHSREMEIRLGIETLAVEAVKKRGRCRTVEAAIVKTEPYAGHDQAESAFPSFPGKKSFEQ